MKSRYIAPRGGWTPRYLYILLPNATLIQQLIPHRIFQVVIEAKLMGNRRQFVDSYICKLLDISIISGTLREPQQFREL